MKHFLVEWTLISCRKCDEINMNEITFRSDSIRERLSVLLVFAFAASIGSSDAAVLHPWCASGTGEESGALYCSYDSYAQCVANVGICQANPAIQPLSGLNVRSATRMRICSTTCQYRRGVGGPAGVSPALSTG